MLSLRSEHKQRDNAANVSTMKSPMRPGLFPTHFTAATAAGDEDETGQVFFL